MNKKISSILMICLLLTTLCFIIGCSDEVIESVGFSISIWKDNLFPTLFPFFVLSNLLMNYGFVDIIGYLLKNVMHQFFHLSGDCGFVLAASLFSGFPSGAKYTKDLVASKRITKEEGARLLTFTHYSNPLFILGMIGNLLLGNPTLALLILIAHISSNLLVGYFMNFKKTKEKTEKLSLLELKNSVKSPSKSFGELLSSSIFDSLNTLFLLLGVVTIFLILTTIIQTVVHFPPLVDAILAGMLEMTQGVKSVSLLNCSLLLKTILITGIISFGGFSVHMQVLGIISSEKIKYKPFLVARLLHALLAMLLVFIFGSFYLSL